MGGETGVPVPGLHFEDGAPLPSHPSVQNFYQGREALIFKEKSHRSDAHFRSTLSPAALKASAIISRIRTTEHLTIWSPGSHPSLELFPGMMFNIAKTHMENTSLWKIVRKMPKGALLHCHLGAMVDLEWFFREVVGERGMCVFSDAGGLGTKEGRERGGGVGGVRFCASFKEEVQRGEREKGKGIWENGYTPGTLVPVLEAAETFPDGGKEGFISYMKDLCSITEEESLKHHLGVDDVWRKLNQAFFIIPGILLYEPLMRKFLRKFFSTVAEDGIRWVEIRTAPYARFALEGQNSADTELSGEYLRVVGEEVERFQGTEKGKGFWGARVIWVGIRAFDTERILEDMKQCLHYKKLYPHLVSGYDLVGQEDTGRTLRSLTPELLWFQSQLASLNLNIPFFFHAGECLGDGDSTDQNLFDAILFGTRRLGHGFSLYKHPTLIDIVKEKNILVESCPISNEVLRYTASIMSHPLPALLARGVKAALSNDDPALLGQGTSGVTHDFWQTLQGWENLGLEGLGSLAQNSVRWAAFEDETEEEWLKSIEQGENGTGIRANRIKQWNEEWEVFCEWVVKEFGEVLG